MQRIIETHVKGSGCSGHLKSPRLLKTRQPSRLNSQMPEELQVASLKVLALTLLKEVNSLERNIASRQGRDFNLKRAVQRFEAALIKSALEQTGGRQRRAARLLGVKVPTLNAKIKRHQVTLDTVNDDSNEVATHEEQISNDRPQ